MKFIIYVIYRFKSVIYQIWNGKWRPADTTQDLNNRAIIIHQRDFYREIRDFLRESINGQDIAYPYKRSGLILIWKVLFNVIFIFTEVNIKKNTTRY